MTGRACWTGATGAAEDAALYRMPVLSWSNFRLAAPQIAAVGSRLLHRPDRGEAAILATTGRDGAPRVAPVCPVFTEQGMYVLAGAATPKVAQFRHDPCYALHAQVGADDLEFQVSGRVRVVDSTAERSEVLAAVPFESFDPQDPIFELLIGRALTVSWPSPGQPVKLRWVAA